MDKINEWQAKLNAIRDSLFDLQDEIYKYAVPQDAKWYEFDFKYCIRNADAALGEVGFAIRYLKTQKK